MGAKLPSKGGFSDLNVTPLIDIVLVVLIIMMVNIPIQVEEMGVKLPGRPTETPPQDLPVEQLVIALYQDGSIALNRTLMPKENLAFEVSRRLRPMDRKNVFVDAAPDVDYGRVIDIVDLAREAGAVTVGLARLKPEGPKEPTSVAPGGLPPGVHVGSPTVVGELTEKRADLALRAGIPAIEQCYRAALGRSARLSGRITVRVGVGPSGEILEHGVISSDVGDADLERCVLEVLPRLPFEPLGEQKTAAAQYPIFFSAG